MDLAAAMPPEVRLLLLRQSIRSLEDHTQDFLNLSHQTDFPDKSFIVFYRTSLNEPLKTQVFYEDPRGSFADFAEQALLLRRSLLTVREVVESSLVKMAAATPEPSVKMAAAEFQSKFKCREVELKEIHISNFLTINVKRNIKWLAKALFENSISFEVRMDGLIREIK